MADNIRMEPAAVKQQAVTLRETAEAFIRSCSKIELLLNKMSATCKSQDSNLFNAISSIDSNYINLLERGYYHFDDLALRMENWADVTMQFEEQAAEKIQNLNNGLNDITSLLNQLK